VVLEATVARDENGLILSRTRTKQYRIAVPYGDEDVGPLHYIAPHFVRVGDVVDYRSPVMSECVYCERGACEWDRHPSADVPAHIVAPEWARAYCKSCNVNTWRPIRPGMEPHMLARAIVDDCVVAEAEANKTA